MPKIQFDPSKEPIGVIELFKRREYLVSLLLLPVLLGMVMGIIGLFLFRSGIYFSNEEELTQLDTLAMAYGYVICLIFVFLSTMKLFSEEVDFSIEQPRTVTISLGVSYIVSFICGRLTISFLAPAFYSNLNTDSPFYDTLLESAGYLSMTPLIAYIAGGFVLIFLVLTFRIAFPSHEDLLMIHDQRSSRPSDMNLYLRSRDRGKITCNRCGNPLPIHAKFCDSCAYPVDLPYQDHTSYQQVSFPQAVRLLDSDHFQRGTRMNIEFECVVHQPASSEQFGGPAPHRTLRVTDHLGALGRSLYIWGDQGHRYNINLASTLKPGDRVLVIGPRRPKDSPYYKDQYGNDVFWIERWNGKSSSSGTRLLKLEDVSQIKSDKFVIPSIETTMTQPKVEYFAPSDDLGVSPPFYCQLCSIKHAAGTPRLQCDSCGRYVCSTSYESMKLAGRTLCPMCEGMLNPV